MSQSKLKAKSRRIFIVRHGERVDLTFGEKAWIPSSFDEKGKYVRNDLNMPLEVPERYGSPQSFADDCPLTLVGETNAFLLGQALKFAGADETIKHVFSSPALRCLQTCKNILKGLGNESKLEIASEPGLYEWGAWHEEGMPPFLTLDECKKSGFRLKEGYEPIIELGKLASYTEETPEEYYERSFYVTKCISSSTQEKGGDILLVGHSSSIDACSRQLIGNPLISRPEMCSIVLQVPFCALAVVEQDIQSGDWKLVEPPVPPMTYSINKTFDWKILTN